MSTKPAARAAATHDDDDADAASGQPQRTFISAARAPLPATSGAPSVFHLAAPLKKERGGARLRLPPLNVAALKPQRRPVPESPKPPKRGSLYDALFERLQPGECFELDVMYEHTLRRIMTKHNKGAARFVIRPLPNNGKQIGLWRIK